MSKVVLADTVSGYRLTTINTNFQAIEGELNDKVLYRDNPDGEPNQMENTLDMNNNRIINLPAPQNPNDAARLTDIPFESVPIGTTSALLTTFSPTANVSAINAQAAIEEVDTENRALSAAIRTDLANEASASTGPGMIDYGLDTSYAVGTVGHKLHQLVHVRTEGALGDGTTDDEVATLAAITRGNSLGLEIHFDGTKTYKIDADSWSIPNNTRLVTNGCTFVCPNTTTGNTVWLTIGTNVVIDKLIISVPTGVRRDRVVSVSDDARIGILRITSADQQANTEAADAAVMITGAKPYVGLLDVVNYDRPYIMAGTTDATFLKILGQSYVRGLYMYDNKRMVIYSGRVHTASPNASASAGHNGMLFGCTTDDAQQDISIMNFIVEDSGEHAYRVGGPQRQTNIRFNQCIARRAGGCGFKVLGTDSGIPTSRNTDITFNECKVYDCGRAGALAAQNKSAFLLKFCDRVTVNMPVSMAINETYAAAYGVFADGATDIRVCSPDMQKCEFDGIAFIATDGDLTACSVDGGFVRQNSRYGYHVQSNTGVTVRQCVATNLSMHGNSNLGFRIDVNGGGFVSNSIAGKTYGNTNGAGSCNNNPSMTLNIVSDTAEVALTPISGIAARNGSTYDDGTTLNVRKAAAWVAL